MRFKFFVVQNWYLDSILNFFGKFTMCYVNPKKMFRGIISTVLLIRRITLKVPEASAFFFQRIKNARFSKI